MQVPYHSSVRAALGEALDTVVIQGAWLIQDGSSIWLSMHMGHLGDDERIQPGGYIDGWVYPEVATRHHTRVVALGPGQWKSTTRAEWPIGRRMLNRGTAHPPVALIGFSTLPAGNARLLEVLGPFQPASATISCGFEVSC